MKEGCTLKNNDIENLLSNQQKFYQTSQTKSLEFRLQQLEILKESILLYEDKLTKALALDLGRHALESYVAEIGFVLNNLAHTIKNLKKWSRLKKVKTPIFLQPATSHILSEPYGTVLIIGPFNYPFQLLMEPLIGALAAGNTAILKPSEMVPNVSRVIFEMLTDTFKADYVTVYLGDKKITQALLTYQFDYIFFTGSYSVAKHVMQAAAEYVTPVTLELGGKSPAIITEHADIALAARRICYGKMLNAGQTCVAPDYVVIAEEKLSEFIKECSKVLQEFYGKDPKQSGSFSRIVNKRHTKRLAQLMEGDRDDLVIGGKVDVDSCYVAPSIYVSSWDSNLMEEEIFGPLLPVITYSNIDNALRKINSYAKPLALYIFSDKKEEQNYILSKTISGGVGINQTVFHLASPYLPFGGIGASGLGQYHGKYSFETFSHKRAVLSSGKIDTPFIAPPYTKRNLSWVKKILK